MPKYEFRPEDDEALSQLTAAQQKREASFLASEYAKYLTEGLGPLVRPLRELAHSGTLSLQRQVTERLLCRRCRRFKGTCDKSCHGCAADLHPNSARKPLNLLLPKWDRKRARRPKSDSQKAAEQATEAQWRQLLQAPGPRATQLARLASQTRAARARSVARHDERIRTV